MCLYLLSLQRKVDDYYREKRKVDFHSTQLYINKKEDVEALNEDFEILGLTNKSDYLRGLIMLGLESKKIDCSFECFEVMKRRYVIFYDEKINNENMKFLLDVFNDNFKNHVTKKTLIIVGHTDEKFNKKDLLFINGVDTFVVYYLINDDNKEIYFNDQRMFWFSVDWNKIIKKFNEILK